MLNDFVHRDKMYILAVEEGQGKEHSWPTGEPGEPRGELSKYSEVTAGPRGLGEEEWEQEVEQNLVSFTAEMQHALQRAAEDLLVNAHRVVEERSTRLDGERAAYRQQAADVLAKERFLDDKLREQTRQTERQRLETDRVAAERAEVERRDEALRREIAAMQDVTRVQEGKVRLDVGGQGYTTSLLTLQRDPDSLLAAMFSGRHSLRQEPDGSYFIDRDGTYFRYILNFLRDGTLEPGTLPANTAAIREILREARYYGLQGMVQYLEDIVSAGSVPSTPDTSLTNGPTLSTQTSL